jgi:hypothetical protein
MSESCRARQGIRPPCYRRGWSLSFGFRRLPGNGTGRRRGSLPLAPEAVEEQTRRQVEKVNDPLTDLAQEHHLPTPVRLAFLPPSGPCRLAKNGFVRRFAVPTCKRASTGVNPLLLPNSRPAQVKPRWSVCATHRRRTSPRRPRTRVCLPKAAAASISRAPGRGTVGCVRRT